MVDYKGFDATAKKLKKIRKNGQLLKSPLLTQSLSFLIIFTCIFNSLQYLWSISPQMLEYCFRVSSVQSADLALKFLFYALKHAGILVLISLLIASACAIFSEIFQSGFEFHFEQLVPKFERINPVKGFQRIASGLKKAPFVFIKLIIALCLIGYLIIAALSTPGLFTPGEFKAVGIINHLSSWIYSEAGLLFLIAISEYFFIRRQFINRHSMSLVEVKTEIREEEGDPHIRAHRKALQEAMIMQEIVRRVRASKVIIVDEQISAY